MIKYTSTAREGLPILAEAQRRVTESHGPRPVVTSMNAPRPSFGPITAAFAVSPRMLADFVAALDSAADARAWDRLVTAECRKIVEEAQHEQH